MKMLRTFAILLACLTINACTTVNTPPGKFALSEYEGNQLQKVSLQYVSLTKNDFKDEAVRSFLSSKEFDTFGEHLIPVVSSKLAERGIDVLSQQIETISTPDQSISSSATPNKKRAKADPPMIVSILVPNLNWTGPQILRIHAKSAGTFRNQGKGFVIFQVSLSDSVNEDNGKPLRVNVWSATISVDVPSFYRFDKSRAEFFADSLIQKLEENHLLHKRK
ncbi:hypothetical protein D3870_01255 [Noviherbaspirillum cavernae]|uniref:DUF3313 domain-containing protein n=1 Tax=Noviherbaspirillum cavernae TaxID=2320862 RepID=A0A418WXA4_9BURK|nr:hypothetical protein [Noviherbaspirillum cavernae]RJG04832.1 hypothetical protein D3870_01255 [Noviherbaspirillum cavernae]